GRGARSVRDPVIRAVAADDDVAVDGSGAEVVLARDQDRDLVRLRAPHRVVDVAEARRGELDEALRKANRLVVRVVPERAEELHLLELIAGDLGYLGTTVADLPAPHSTPRGVEILAAVRVRNVDAGPVDHHDARHLRLPRQLRMDDVVAIPTLEFLRVGHLLHSHYLPPCPWLRPFRYPVVRSRAAVRRRIPAWRRRRLAI